MIKLRTPERRRPVDERLNAINRQLDEDYRREGMRRPRPGESMDFVKQITKKKDSSH